MNFPCTIKLQSHCWHKASFQQALAEVLSQEYMEYINGQNLTVEEAKVGFDLDGDGELNSTVSLTIVYDVEK